MSDYSAVAPPQNFSQSSAFAAALQRAKQVSKNVKLIRFRLWLNHISVSRPYNTSHLC